MTLPDRRRPLLLEGAPRARGRGHGEALRPLIHDLFAAWGEELRVEAGLDLGAYLDRFDEETRFAAALRRWTPDLLEEVEGIAEGAALPLREVMCLQLMDEHWAHLARLSRRTAAPRRPAARCSCLGQVDPATGAALIAQNMDLPKFLDGYQVLLRIRPAQAELELLVPSYAGFIGLLGLNSRGIGVCVNALSQLRSAPTGLPVAFVIRSVLERATLAEAAAQLRRVPHATGQNYLLGGPGGLVDLECSAGGVAQLRPHGGRWTATTLCHTNHPLASADLGEGWASWDADRARADQAHALTFTRLGTLERALGCAPLSVEQALAALAAVRHPIDGPFDAFTFCSAVLELGSRPRLHLALGPWG